MYRCYHYCKARGKGHFFSHFINRMDSQIDTFYLLCEVHAAEEASEMSGHAPKEPQRITQRSVTEIQENRFSSPFEIEGQPSKNDFLELAFAAADDEFDRQLFLSTN